MNKKIASHIILLGDNINTDVIYPGKYLPIIEPAEMAKHALEGIDLEFPNRIKQGDIIVAGENFGCGSSREQAATCLKMAGIACILARSYSRIFYRNAINQGLPAITLNHLIDDLKNGDPIQIDFALRTILLNHREYSFEPFPQMIENIINAGGLIASLKQKSL